MNTQPRDDQVPDPLPGAAEAAATGLSDPGRPGPSGVPASGSPHPASGGMRPHQDAAGTVTVRYWAGAKAAAGVDREQVPAGTVASVLTAVGARHRDAVEIVALCAVLVDGQASAPDDPIPPGATVDLLPPFAGG